MHSSCRFGIGASVDVFFASLAVTGIGASVDVFFASLAVTGIGASVDVFFASLAVTGNGASVDVFFASPAVTDPLLTGSSPANLHTNKSYGPPNVPINRFVPCKSSHTGGNSGIGASVDVFFASRDGNLPHRQVRPRTDLPFSQGGHY